MSSSAAAGEPTPWVTGLTVTAIVAGLSLAIDLLLSTALRSAFGWLWIPANVVLSAGLAPSVWLLRTAPVWRWVAYGVAVGFGVAWVCLAIGLVFRG